ncbi:MAG: hypothetical protein KF779_14060 [Hyphomonadaceae bacterium]|nr:hypothetical protein [Hyphomonadaceae bacterium]
MTLVLRHHTGLELNRAEFCNAITATEVTAMIDLQVANPFWLSCDALNIVTPGAYFDFELSGLDKIFERYRALFADQSLMILRRAAWICRSPAAQRHIRHWVDGRNLREGMSSDVRQFDTFDDACAWLVLAPQHAPTLETGDGFTEIGRFDMPNAKPIAR